MKKHLLFLVALLAATMTLNARVILIDEGFENGIQDSVWTQEFADGEMPWAIEDAADNLSYPSTVIQGNKRAFLRNNTGETIGYATRLVSKAMDLRAVHFPELIFWYANPKWGADRDTLRVLYRTSRTSKWKKLAEIGDAHSDWQRYKVSLPDVGSGSAYQIAFEGKDNLGHGIVLDSIIVQSAPDCTMPYDLMATSKGAGKVTLSWVANFDAYYYELIVSKDTIDPNMIEEIEAETPEKIVYHRMVAEDWNYDLQLESGEFYLAYVRSLCGDENSAWSSETEEGPFGFHVRTTREVPFTEGFNYPSGTHRDEDWNWGGNMPSLNPFVNSETRGNARANYSPDTTAAVVFSGGTTSQLTTVLPASRYIYLATPALTDSTNVDFRVNQCQVHFWSTVYTNTGRQYGRSIIVGVMDDPDDIKTFTPVDTVSVWGNKTFQENIVDLSSYQGYGAFVAFVSNFDRENLFFIDNVTVEYRKTINKVTKISVNPRDTYATISWEGNANSYDVLVTSAEVNPNNPTASAIIAQASVNTTSYLCRGLEPNHSWNRPYYVYVKAAGTEWSYRYPFVTIASTRDIPYSFTFESNATTKYSIPGVSGQFAEGLGIFGNNGTYPAVSVGSTNSYAGSGYLFLSKRGGADAWITLPMVEEMDSVQVKFYLSGGSTVDQAHATIGVMTNPMDINTFVEVSHFTLNTQGYTRCYANFENYNGPDGVIAIMWDDVMRMTANTNNYIDEIIVEKLSDCVPPTNINLEVEPDSLTVRWDISSANDWEFFLSRVPLKESDRVTKTFDEIAAMGGVVVAQTLSWTNPSAKPVFGFGGLLPHVTYYLYVRAICDMTWWSEDVFTTPCRDESYPYKETFENYNLGSTSAGCWQLADYMGVGYPSIYQAGTTTTSNKALELYSSGTIHRSVAVLPIIEGDYADMLLSFDVRTKESGATGVVYIGTMEDITNSSSFVPVDTVIVSGNTFKKVRFFLSNYDLIYEHLAITSGLGSLKMSSDIVIDNVELKDPTCLEAYDYQQINLAPHTIDLTWEGMSDNDEWQLKVLKSNIDVNAVKNNTYPHALEIVSDTVFTGKNFHMAGLTAETTYYAYVRALCGDSIWTTTPIFTTCERINPTKANKENFESYASGTSYSTAYVPNCWTSGNADPDATSYYLPYVYYSSTFSNSGTNAFRMYGTSSYNPAYIISPELECDSITHVAVTFNMYSSTSYAWLCGVMTDPNDLSTFVVVDSVKGTGSSVQYTYDLSEFAGTLPASAKYFAWRTPYGGTHSAYLDDVSFISVACPLTKPSISELTGNSVRVSGGLRTSDPWIVMVTNKAISDANLAKEDYVVPAANLVYIDTVSRRSTTITGLEAQTKYFVYTATLCEDTVRSQWNSLVFTTPCQAITPEDMGTITFSDKDGYETGSGGEMPCWIVGSKTQNASSSYIPYVEATASTMHNGYNYLKLYDYSSTSSSSTVGAYAIMPELDVDSISKYQINFWGRSNSSTSYNNQVIVGVITDPSDLNTFVAIDTLNLSRSTWDPYSVGFESYEGDYMGDLGRYVMFLSDFGSSNYAYISEISAEPIPHCRPISSFSVDSVGEDAAVVSWKGYQDSYRVLMAPRALTEEEKPHYHYLIDTVVNSSEDFRIENLEPSSNYYVYAQGICENGDSTAISIVYGAIRTTCPTTRGVPVPFYDDFESYELDDDSPGCWQFLYTGSYSSWFAVKQVESNGSKAIDVYSSSNNAYAVLPRVDANLEDLKLSFDARQFSNSSAQMYVGVMGDVNDVTTFVLLRTFDLAATEAFTTCRMSLGDFDLPYDNLVITAGIQNVTPSRYDVYLDNVALEYESSCNAPKLKYIGSSFETAELSLTPAKREDGQWQIVVIPENEYELISNITSYLNAAEKITLDSTHIVLTGLQQATSYYVFARTICSETETSTWTRTPLKFSTQFYYESSYFFGFEHSGEDWQRSMYSESDNYYLHPALVEGRDEQGEESQSYIYYPHSRENTDTYLYARPLSTNNLGALLMHAKSNYYGGYVIFPSIDVASARSLEFKLRPGYLDKATMLPVASSDAAVEIGTIEKGTNFDTYQALATIRINQLDPTTTAKSKNNYLFSNYSVDFDSLTMATRQLVFHMPKQPNDSAYLFIDDVRLDATKGFSLVALNKVIAEGSSAMVEWANIGGPWNLVVTDAAGNPVAQYENLTATSQLVENLQPQTDYTVTLTAASVPTSAKNYVTSDKLSFRTLCLALEPSANGEFVWDFNNPYEWEENDILGGEDNDSLYFKPACFQVGITYDAPVNGYQWLVERKGYEPAGALSPYNANRHYEVGRNDSYAMRVHTTNTAYNSYLILPELNCSLDTMMIEFYGRCFVSYDRNYSTPANRGKIVETTYLGNAYSQSIVIGTLTDPNDWRTLQVLDTLTYSHTNLTIEDNVNDDPTGLRYWELMRAPLENARGKYIVLFQPAPGLFYLDDLSVKPIGNTLFAPTGTRTSNITETTATVSWNTHHPEMTTVVVLLNAEGEEIGQASVTGTSYEITNLQPSMSYSWYVYQTNGAEVSPTTKPVQFATECAALTPEYTCSFEPAEGWQVIEGQSSAYTQTLCWTYGDAAQDTWTTNYGPYNQANTSYYKYSLTGSHALMMRASYSTRSTYQPYVAMPAMDIAAYDTLLVSFWMRPAYVSASSDSVVMTYTGSTYSKSVIVGTMTDPTNAATFVAIDTITYDGTLSTANGATAANNFLFQQAKVELTGATGPYVAIMTSFYQKGSQAQKTGDYIWLDDIAFERISECKTPKELTALQVGTHHATLSWDTVDYAGRYLLQVSTDPYFSDERSFVFNDVVESNAYTVTGLNQMTTYVWRVQSLCEGRWTESAFSTKATFKTARSPYFMEPFTTTINASEWTFSKSHADNILDAGTPLTRGTDNWSFMRTTVNYGLEGAHYVAAGYSSDYHWLATPTFYLPEEDSVHFSMDLALTACNTSHTATGNAVTENDMKDDYYFMIVVSDDGGATWKSANILDKWQNTNPQGKQLRDIPSTGMKVRYSLAAYAGKNVRIGLYREARTTGNTGIAIHVDNVRLGYFDKTVDYASACQYEDIVIGDIVLSGDDTEPGIHAYPTPYYASDADAKAGKRDSVFQLEIEVFPAQETFFADTICEGDTYTNYDFRPKSVSGVYHRKLLSVEHGCDSIVTLNLHVKERRYAETEEVALCQGESYIWNGKPYNRAGLYRDTTISSIGCDSIMTLIVSYAEGGAAVQTFYDSSRVEVGKPFTYENILYPYAEGQAPIYYPAGTPKGTYVDTVKIQGEACTNLLVHTLVIYDPKEDIDSILDGMGEARKVIYRDQMYIICNDEWYNALGQKVADPRK